MKVKLKDIIIEVNERTTKNNQYPILTSSQNGIFLQEEYFKKNVASKNNIGYKIIRKGEFTYRSMSDTGNFTINRLENIDIGIVSPAYPVFKCNGVNPDYLKYYFSSNNFKRQIDNLYQGGTRVALKLKDLENIEIEIPTEDEQTKIVKLLKNLDNLISRYEEAVKEKEQFIKSQFVEMFENDKYEKIELKNVTDIKGRVGWKGYTKADLRSNGPLVLGATHISNDGLIDLSEPVYISEEKYDESPEIMIKTNDLIFAQRGSLGKVGLVNYDLGKATINPCVLIIRPIKINPQFLRFLLIIEYENGNLSRLNSGSTIPMISQKTIGNYRIINPNIQEQNKFASFVELIDKQKFELEKQKKNYELLKKGIMQRLIDAQQ